MYTRDNNKHMITLNKEDSTTYAEIRKIKTAYGPRFHATINQGEGHNKTLLDYNDFITEAGARRWVAKQFAI